MKRTTYRIEIRETNREDAVWHPYPNAWGVPKTWAEGFLFCMDGFYKFPWQENPCPCGRDELPHVKKS